MLQCALQVQSYGKFTLLTSYNLHIRLERSPKCVYEPAVLQKFPLLHALFTRNS